jgi:hypothetical protein
MQIRRIISSDSLEMSPYASRSRVRRSSSVASWRGSLIKIAGARAFRKTGKRWRIATNRAEKFAERRLCWSCSCSGSLRLVNRSTASVKYWDDSSLNSQSLSTNSLGFRSGLQNVSVSRSSVLRLVKASNESIREQAFGEKKSSWGSPKKTSSRRQSYLSPVLPRSHEPRFHSTRGGGVPALHSHFWTRHSRVRHDIRY